MTNKELLDKLRSAVPTKILENANGVILVIEGYDYILKKPRDYNMEYIQYSELSNTVEGISNISVINDKIVLMNSFDLSRHYRMIYEQYREQFTKEPPIHLILELSALGDVYNNIIHAFTDEDSFNRRLNHLKSCRAVYLKPFLYASREELSRYLSFAQLCKITSLCELDLDKFLNGAWNKKNVYPDTHSEFFDHSTFNDFEEMHKKIINQGEDKNEN